MEGLNMKKKLYNIIKAELKKRRENTRYFNYDFFVKYVNAIQAGEKARKAAIDDSYKDGYITKYRHYDEIYKDRFYNDNGGCYCEFLAVASKYYNRLMAL